VAERAGQLGEVVGPGESGIGAARCGQEDVDDREQEIVLVPDVPAEAHRRHAEIVGQLAERHGGEAVAGAALQGGIHDLLACELGRGHGGLPVSGAA
jgi:hypothetical protein